MSDPQLDEVIRIVNIDYNSELFRMWAYNYETNPTEYFKTLSDFLTEFFSDKDCAIVKGQSLFITNEKNFILLKLKYGF